MRVIFKQTRGIRAFRSPGVGNLRGWHTFRGTASGGDQLGPGGQEAGGLLRDVKSGAVLPGPDQPAPPGVLWVVLPPWQRPCLLLATAAETEPSQSQHVESWGGRQAGLSLGCHRLVPIATRQGARLVVPELW